MSVVKDKLLSHIEELQSEKALKAIWEIVDGVDSEGVYHLSASQEKDIDESLEQVSKGEVVSHNELFSRLRSW